MARRKTTKPDGTDPEPEPETELGTETEAEAEAEPVAPEPADALPAHLTDGGTLSVPKHPLTKDGVTFHVQHRGIRPRKRTLPGNPMAAPAPHSDVPAVPVSQARVAIPQSALPL
jgi:hypothetical protein